LSDRLDKSIAIGLLAAIVFTALAHGAVEPWSLALLELVLISLLLLWGIKATVDRRLEVNIPAAALPMAVLLLLGIVQSVAFTGEAGQTVSLSMDVEATRRAVTVLFFLAASFIVTVNFFATCERLLLLANVLTVFGALLGAFSLIQFFTWDGRFYWLRSTGQTVFGPFVNRNHFAGYMAMLMPVPLGLILRAVRGQARLVYGFAAALMGTATLVSNSRSGVISLAAAIVLMAILNRRCAVGALYDRPAVDRAYSDASEPKRFRLSRIGPIAIVALAMIAGALWIGAAPIVEHFGEAVDQLLRSGSPDVSRANIWQDTLKMIHDHPLLGAGLGTYHTIYPAYGTTIALFGLDYAHNDYLQVAAEFGIAGAVIAVWFIVVIFAAIHRAIHSRDPLFAGLALAGAAGIFAVLVQSLSETDLQIPSNALLFLVLSAVVSRVGAGEEEGARIPLLAESARRGKRSFRVEKDMRTAIAFTIVVLLFSGLNVAAAQDKPPSAPAPRGIVLSPEEEYRIGPSDVVEVYILRMAELSREYRVGADGTIEMPFLGKIKAQKKTSQELAALIADGLRDGYLVDPQVSIIVKQVNRRFFIQGAVHSPGVYNIEGRPSLLELITIAGGLNPSYGASAFIIRGIRPRPDEVQTVAVSDSETRPDYELRKANINALLRGDFAENVAIEPGDIVHIPPTDVFFVAGEVKAPGSFPLKEGTTLRQAISLAQGANPFAAPGKAVIFREETGGQKREIPVDVKAVMRGRSQDVAILANDVIVIPNSRAKSAFMPVISAFGTNAAWTVTSIIR